VPAGPAALAGVPDAVPQHHSVPEISVTRSVMLRVARVRPMHSAGCAVEVLAVTVAGWLADHRERIAFARNASSLFGPTIFVGVIADTGRSPPGCPSSG
jgi:hypothetical protein